MYEVEVAFPSGRFYAARADDPEQPEWPPHPGRLLSALVAAAGSLDSPEERRDALEALRWLERQPAPEIAGPEAMLEPAPPNFVPPGDKLKIDKNRVEDPFRRVPNRHERYFPCAYILGPPRVLYRWPDAEPDAATAAALESLAARTTHVGTTHAMTLVRSLTGRPQEEAGLGAHVWRPAKTSHGPGLAYLRVASEGRVDELLAAYGKPKAELVLRRAPARCERLLPYLAQHPTEAIEAAEFRWLVVLRTPGSGYEARDADVLGRALRTAVMSVMDDPLPPQVHGHGPAPHVGWWLLPDVRPPTQPNAEHARGRMLGFGLALPRTLGHEGEQAVLQAVRALERRGVHVRDGRDLFPRLISPGEALPLGLRWSTWTRPAKVWATVTPIIPNRLPSRPTDTRIRRALVQAAVAAGLPEPREVVPSQQSYFYGAPTTREVRAKLPRYHAVFRWDRPVRGPLALGRARFFGGGLLRPARELEPQIGQADEDRQHRETEA